MVLAAEQLQDRDLRARVEIDAEVPFDYLTMDLAQMLSQLEPTGARNEAPLLLTRGLRVVECRRVGQEGKHLKLKLSNGINHIDGIGFKQGEWAENSTPFVDVVYHLEINEWNGQVKLQLNVQDLRPAGQGD